MLRKKLAIAAAFLLGIVQAGMSIEVINKENVRLNMHGRMQMFGLTDYVLDEWRDHIRVFLFVRQARLAFDGDVNGIRYDVEYAFGGEEGLKNTGGTVANSSLGLLDFSAEVPTYRTLAVKFGQFKVPYGLERMENSGDLMFTDRSIAHLPFNLGRDVGVALYDNAEKYSYAFALMTGGGRDNPLRNLPLRLGTPMVVFRGGIKNNMDDSLFDPKQVDPDGLKPGFGAFVNAMYQRDSRVGHSTVMQVKPVEKGLLTDPNWNQFLALKDVTGGSNFLLGDLWQAGGDTTWRTNAGPGLLTLEAEANYGQYKNSAGWLEMSSARAQVSFFKNPWGIGLRYAVLFTDDKATSTGGRKILENKMPIHEIAPSITLFHKKYFKIVLDAPVLIDVPVSIENKLGYYVLTDQPDQTNAGSIIRQVVPSGRMVAQLSF